VILPHEFAPGWLSTHVGNHCRDCGYIEADPIHDTEPRPTLLMGLRATATAEVIPGNSAEGAP
jgi:hypothetical protein